MLPQRLLAAALGLVKVYGAAAGSLPSSIPTALEGITAAEAARTSTVQDQVNAGFVATPGDTLGKQQPRLPKWRACALLSITLTPSLDTSLAPATAASHGAISTTPTSMAGPIRASPATSAPT